ncbi:MAG: hypothetical protein OER88_11825, partial [Planctomycetota bacterium]|nr:hypothetical protein [Planctomycetota bacterium]
MRSIRFVRRSILFVSVVSMVTMLLAAPAWAQGEVCPPMPEGLVLDPEQPLTVAGKSFRISVRHYPPLSGDGAGHLELDLMP